MMRILKDLSQKVNQIDARDKNVEQSSLPMRTKSFKEANAQVQTFSKPMIPVKPTVRIAKVGWS